MITTFFAAIHEFAVLGTTFFILALATLWYSPLMFGNLWLRVSKTTGVVFDETKAGFWKQLGIAFVAYLGMVTLVALAVTFTSVTGLPLGIVMLGASVFIACVTVPPALFEARPWQYYGIHTGFMILSVLVAAVLLTYWPW